MANTYGLLCVVFLMTCLGCSQPSSSDNYASKVQSVREAEAANPLKFIKCHAMYRSAVVGKKFVVDVTISNGATLVVFKDPVIRIDFLSKTGTSLGSDEQVIYELLQPGSSKTFKIKTGKPRNAESISVSVIRASVAK